MEDTVHVKGLSDLGKFITTFPIKFQRNVLRGGLRAGSKPIRDRARSNVRVAAPSTENSRIYNGYAGALRDSIVMSSTKIKGSIVVAGIRAGGKLKGGASVYYAHMIERTGAKPHVIKAKPGRKLGIGGKFYTQVQHPGFKPSPFLVPAMDQEAGAAVVATGNYIKGRLTQTGLDTSAINVEEE